METALHPMSIERIRRRHKREWLLIVVDRFDKRTTTPLTGRLLAHSKLRVPLEKRAAQTKELTYVVFGTDTLPKGYAAAF